MIDAFVHNWADAVTVENAWKTAISTSPETQAEERVGLVDRPVRSLSFRWTGVNREEGNRMLLALATATGAGLALPLYPDQATTSASSSGTTINCATADRRFAVGRHVMIAEIVNGRAANVRVRSVSAVGSGTLTLSTSLGATYPAGSLVWPVVVTQPVLAPAVRYMTNEVMEVTLTALERLDQALPALQAPGEVPSGEPTCQVGDLPALPVLTIEPDWGPGVTIGLARDAEAFARGRADVVLPLGGRPRFTLEASLLLADRATAFRALRLFDGRAGRLATWWLAAPMGLWRPAALDTGFVDVATAGDPEQAEETYTFLAVVLRDGTVHVRPIAAIAGITGGWRISVSDSLPEIDLADVRRVCPAWLVRFASDALREEWVTTRVCQIQIRAVEVLAEREAALA